MKIALSSLVPEELAAELELKPVFRSKQLFKWIQEGTDNFEDMSNLPKSLRYELEENAVLRQSRLRQTFRDSDGTVKAQIELQDGKLIEAVLLSDASDRKTACISSQVGCPIACVFCKTGQIGFKRNLRPAEIIEQFFYLQEIHGNISNIVFMGMGEPLLNLEAVRKVIAVLNHPEGQNIGKRRFTISTSGIPLKIRELADKEPQVSLALSLISARDDVRRRLIPGGDKLGELKVALQYYQEKSGKRISLEIVLLKDLNDGEAELSALKSFINGLSVFINLIPWNPVPELPFSESPRHRLTAFENTIASWGVPVASRHKRGRSLQAACGQLGGSLGLSTVLEDCPNPSDTG